ncbi:MAG: hypothetical protein II635_03845 [Oscillospiraceae bacterium]|nr:hypothetical protein [Oscillospiraceae bacterium]
MKALIIDAVRETYGKENVRTMTVGELMNYLEQFDEDRLVILSHDSGYTYGGIREEHFINPYEDDE